MEKCRFCNSTNIKIHEAGCPKSFPEHLFEIAHFVYVYNYLRAIRGLLSTFMSFCPAYNQVMDLAKRKAIEDIQINEGY